MKYDIEGFEKTKVIKEYKIKKKKNNRYDVIIYYRSNETGKALNYPYEDMIDLKKELDDIMLNQMKILVQNKGITFMTLDKLVNKKVGLFAIIGTFSSTILPITLSVILNNVFILILMPVFLKITLEYLEEMPYNILTDEKKVLDSYQFYVENKEEIEKKKTNLNVNTIDNYKVKKLLKLKSDILYENEKQKVLVKKR